MKKELKENKYLILTLVLLIAFAISTPILYKSLNKNESPKDQTDEKLNQSTINNNFSDDRKNNQDSPSKDNTTNDKQPSPDNTNNNNQYQESENNQNTNNNDYQEKRTEEDVITYFEETESFITTYSNQPMTDSITTKLKNGFTTIVDFLFYDKPIKGYTFKELTLSAKLKICKIALSIDQKIDSYFPSYKETIKNGFNSLKGKVISLYLELTSKACEKVGSTVCEQARLDFKNMKEVLKIDWQLIKSFAGSSKAALSEWYQSLK